MAAHFNYLNFPKIPEEFIRLIITQKEEAYKERYADGIHPQEDWNLWDKMREQGATVASLNEGLLYYRRHRENFLKYDHLVDALEEEA